MVAFIRGTQQALPTSGSTVDITVPGIGTPAAALFFCTRATANGSSVDGSAIMLGFTDGTEEYCATNYSEHGQASSDCGSGVGTASIYMYDDDGVVECEFTFNQWITDGVRLNVVTAPPSAYLCNVVFIAGDSAEAEVGGFVSPAVINTSVNISCSSLSQEPDFVLAISSLSSADDTHSAGGGFFVGIATPDGTNKGVSFHERNNAGTANVAQWATANSVIKTVVARATGAVQGSKVELNNFYNSGFFAETLDSSQSIRCKFLAVYLGGKSVTIETVLSPNSTGDDTISVSGSIKPQAALGLISMAPFPGVMEEDADGGGLGLCFFSENEEFSACIAIEEGADTTNTQSLVDNTAVRLSKDDGSASLEASLSSFDSGEAVLSYSTADSSDRTLFMLFIEEDPTIVSPSTGSLELGQLDPNISIEFAAPAASMELGQLDPSRSITFFDTTQHAELGQLDPVVGLGVLVSPATGSLELGQLDPSVAFGVLVSATTGSLELGQLDPTFSSILVASAGPLLLGAPTPTVELGNALVLAVPSGKLLVGNIGVLVLNGKQYLLNRSRIVNALRERAGLGMFLPARIDPNTGAMQVLYSDYDRIKPSYIGVDEINSLARRPLRNRQTERRERAAWNFELDLQFVQAASVEVFERDIASSVPVLARDAANDLQQVRLNWLDTRYEHPPSQNSSSGTRAIMTFEAVLSPV